MHGARLAALAATENQRRRGDPLRRPTDGPVLAAACRLAVYGTLAPGEVNHGEVADLAGEWTPASIRGHLHHSGWGAAAGFPGIVLDGTAPPVAVQLLSSPGLARAWPRLDEFEGPGYRRVLCVVEVDGAAGWLANVYELSDGAVPPSAGAPAGLTAAAEPGTLLPRRTRPREDPP